MGDREEALGAEKRCCEALAAGDVTTLSKLFADDMVLIHATGRVDTKEGLLAAVESGRAKYLSIEVADESIRCFGGLLALVGGVMTMVVEVGGERRVLRNRFTNTWQKVADGRQMENWQSTAVPK